MSYYDFGSGQRIPIRTGRWFIRYQLVRAGDNASQVRQVANLAEGHRLHQRVAHRSGFVRADDDAAAVASAVIWLSSAFLPPPPTM